LLILHKIDTGESWGDNFKQFNLSKTENGHFNTKLSLNTNIWPVYSLSKSPAYRPI